MSKNAANAVPNIALYNLRTTAGLSQQDVASRINELASNDGRNSLGVTANTVSRWERGVVTPAPFYRRLLAELFTVSVDDLGFVLHREESMPRARPASGYVANIDVTVDPRVTHSQEAWCGTRQALNANRAALTQLAAQLYDRTVRLHDTGLIASPDWLPTEPIELGAIELEYRVNANDPELNGTEPETDHVRPMATLVRRYPRYTQAIRDLAHPKLFENRASWRMTDLSWEQDKGKMTFGPTMYFAGVDIYEALAHEMAYVHLAEDGSLKATRPMMRDVPFRRLISDPFDFGRRPVLPLDRHTNYPGGADEASFVLHRRDPRSVAIAGGMLQVIPSGVFQPSSVLPTAMEADFDLWRNMMRSTPRNYSAIRSTMGDGQPVRYDQEPFRSLDQARQDGRATVWCLGVALDALTLVGEILDRRGVRFRCVR